VNAEQLVGRWENADDPTEWVEFALADDALVVTAGDQDEEFQVLSMGATTWTVRVTSTYTRFTSTILEVYPETFRVHCFNSNGAVGNTSYVRTQPKPVGDRYCAEGCGHDFGKVFTPPIPCEGCEGHQRGFDTGYVRGCEVEQARIIAVIADNGPLHLRLGAFMSGYSYAATAALAPARADEIGTQALAELMRVIRYEIEVRDG
jgi:hypothetical protein